MICLSPVPAMDRLCAIILRVGSVRRPDHYEAETLIRVFG